FGDRAVVEDHAADQLDVEVPLAEGPSRRFPRERERLGEELVEGGAFAGALAELLRSLLELLVAVELQLGLEVVDLGDPLLELLELLALAHAECAFEDRHEGEVSTGVGRPRGRFRRFLGACGGATATPPGGAPGRVWRRSR